MSREAAARLAHKQETDTRMLRNSGFETAVDHDGSVIARKGDGMWKSTADIFGKV